jgi:competence protein ComEC
MWAAGPPRALPDRPEAGLVCGPAGCTLRRAPAGRVAMLLTGPADAAACAADVLASLEPIRLECPEPAPALIDRFSLWRDGAHAVWLEPDGVRVLSDRAARGLRPWVSPPPE